LSLSTFLLAVVLSIGIYFTHKIQNYPSLTLDKVYNDIKQMSIYGLKKNQRTPGDFGFNNYKNVIYFNNNKMTLKGWYIEAPVKSSKCYVIYHGRSSNRLKTLTYLRLLKELKIDKTYNIFLPDLRNSGESSKAITAMGYYVADDIYNSLQFLKNKKNNSEFILHGFSMGALGITLALQRYEKELKNLSIKKLILDSPVSNVKELIKYEVTRRMVYPSFLAVIGSNALNMKLGFSLNSMRLSHTLKNTKISTIIVSAENDPKAPQRFLNIETFNLPKSHVKFVSFKTGNHGRLFLKEEKKYSETISSFIND